MTASPKAIAALWLSVALLLLTGCSSDEQQPAGWVDDDVSFVADGLTIYGTYRHRPDGGPAAAALLISESGPTDRNGDNTIAGPVGNMRQLAELLSDRGVASLRYDKVGTGKTGLGPYAGRRADVGSAVYTTGAGAAVRFLAEQPGTDKARISVYALGEGAIHAMSLAADTAPGAPKIRSLGLFQPLPVRYLDIMTGQVRAESDASVAAGGKTRQEGEPSLADWTAADDQARISGTAPALPEGLGAILTPANA